MSFFVKHNTLFRVLLTVFVLLYALLQTGTAVAMENKKVINDALGVTDYKIVETGDGNVDTDYYKSDYTSLATLMSDTQDKAAEVMAEGAVLVKNDNAALPLSKGDYVGLFDYGSYSPAYGGSGSAASRNPKPEVTMLQGMTDAGLTVNETLWNFYKNNPRYAPVAYDTKDAPWEDLMANSGVANSLNTRHNAAVVVISRSRGENYDPDLKYLQLSANEKSLLLGLKELKGKTVDKVIVLFNTPNQVETDFLDDPTYGVDAALWVGTVGQTGLTAVGKILVGDVNPSGKLSDTWWNKHTYNPSYTNFGATRYANADDFADLPAESADPDDSYTQLSCTRYVSYTEGIYVGYRYTETRYEDVVTTRANVGNFDYGKVVSRPFGYGLSYTTFDYTDMSVAYNSENDIYTIAVTVTNTGATSGKEVVQLYLQKPYTDYDVTNGIEKAAVELVGFAKTDVLGAGESQRVQIAVGGRSLASYDANKARTYITEEGNYYFAVGKDAHDATNNILAAKGFSQSSGMTADGNAKLAAEQKHGARRYDKAENGQTITNLFDQADWNKYDNNGGTSVTYVSRANWTGTLPEDVTTLYMTAEMVAEILSYNTSDSVEPDFGDMPTMGADNVFTLVELRTDVDGNIVDFDSELWQQLLDQLTWDELCAVISNGMRRTEAAASVTKPATVENNGPNGLTQKYSFGDTGLANKYNDPDKDYSPTYYPSIGILASTFNVTLANEVGVLYGEDALWCGYSGLYGIGLNIHRTAFDGRAFEYYSEDPLLTGKMAAALVMGLQSKGCNAYVKHLVAYEQQGYRVGLAVWANEQTLREIYLRPFQTAIEEGGAMNAMSAYTRLGTVFCAGNKALLTDYLRGECGMKGFVVSDMYKNRYKNEQLVSFLMAGCDLPDGDLADLRLYDMYKDDYSAVVKQMRTAAHRILYATAHSNAMNGYSATKRIVYVTVGWQVALTVGCVVTGVAAGASIVAFALSEVLKYAAEHKKNDQATTQTE